MRACVTTAARVVVLALRAADSVLSSSSLALPPATVGEKGRSARSLAAHLSRARARVHPFLMLETRENCFGDSVVKRVSCDVSAVIGRTWRLGVLPLTAAEARG